MKKQTAQEPFDYQSATANEIAQHLQDIGMNEGIPPWTGPKGPDDIPGARAARQVSRKRSRQAKGRVLNTSARG